MKINWPIMLRRVEGESMLPALKNGRILVGYKWFKDLEAGDLVIVHHDNLEKIKRVDRNDGDRLYLIGDNSGSSTDSRHFGWVSKSQVLAKVIRFA